jgi:hypothetical protein
MFAKDGANNSKMYLYIEPLVWTNSGKGDQMSLETPSFFIGCHCSG